MQMTDLTSKCSIQVHNKSIMLAFLLKFVLEEVSHPILCDIDFDIFTGFFLLTKNSYKIVIFVLHISLFCFIRETSKYFQIFKFVLVTEVHVFINSPTILS